MSDEQPSTEPAEQESYEPPTIRSLTDAHGTGMTADQVAIGSTDLPG